MPIFYHAQAWEEYGIKYAVHKELWRNCVLATLGPHPDKGDKARDLTGRRNHGTLTNGPTWSNQTYRGQTFRGCSFVGGVDDKIVFPAALSVSWTDYTAPFTMACWAFIRSWRGEAGSEMCMFGSIGTVNNQSISFCVWKKTLQLIGDTTGGASWDIGEPTILPIGRSKISLNTWYHLAITRSSGGVYSAWIDGKLDGTATLAANLITNDSTFQIGGHYGGNTTYDGNSIISDFRVYGRVLTQAEISTTARHPLTAYAVRLPEYFFGASTAVTLTVAGSDIEVTTDSPTLTQHNTLAVGNAVCSVTSGNVALVQHSALTVQSSQLATSSQSPALTQHNALTVADSKCVVSSETLALTQRSALTVQGSVCAVTAGNIALTQHAALTVQDCSVALNSQSPVLSQHSVLAVGDSQCAATSQEVTLTQHGALVVENANCAVTSENVELTAYAPAVVTLTVHGSTCVISSTSPVLTQHGALIVAASQCLVSSGNVTLVYHAAGAALILEHQTLLLAI
jgi:hypothetical protein